MVRDVDSKDYVVDVFNKVILMWIGLKVSFDLLW